MENQSLLSPHLVYEVLDYLPIKYFYTLTLINSELRDRYGPVLALPGYENDNPLLSIRDMDLNFIDRKTAHINCTSVGLAIDNAKERNGVHNYNSVVDNYQRQLILKHKDSLEFLIHKMDKPIDFIMPNLKFCNSNFKVVNGETKKHSLSINERKQVHAQDFAYTTAKVSQSCFTGPEIKESISCSYKNVAEIQSTNGIPRSVLLSFMLSNFCDAFDTHENANTIVKLLMGGTIDASVLLCDTTNDLMTTIFMVCNVLQWTRLMDSYLKQAIWLFRRDNIQKKMRNMINPHHDPLWSFKQKESTVRKLDLMHKHNWIKYKNPIDFEIENPDQRNHLLHEYLVHRHWFRFPTPREVLTHIQDRYFGISNSIPLMVQSIQKYGWDTTPHSDTIKANDLVVLVSCYKEDAHTILTQVRHTLNVFDHKDWKGVLLVACSIGCSKLLGICCESIERVDVLENITYLKNYGPYQIPMEHSLSELFQFNAKWCIKAIEKKRIPIHVVQCNDTLSKFCMDNCKSFSDETLRQIFLQ
jgi:hypothetical protein